MPLRAQRELHGAARGSGVCVVCGAEPWSGSPSLYHQPYHPVREPFHCQPVVTLATISFRAPMVCSAKPTCSAPALPHTTVAPSPCWPPGSPNNKPRGANLPASKVVCDYLQARHRKSDSVGPCGGHPWLCHQGPQRQAGKQAKKAPRRHACKTHVKVVGALLAVKVGPELLHVLDDLMQSRPVRDQMRVSVC